MSAARSAPDPAPVVISTRLSPVFFYASWKSKSGAQSLRQPQKKPCHVTPGPPLLVPRIAVIFRIHFNDLFIFAENTRTAQKRLVTLLPLIRCRASTQRSSRNRESLH